MGGRDGTLVVWDITEGVAKRELSSSLRASAMSNQICWFIMVYLQVRLAFPKPKSSAIPDPRGFGYDPPGCGSAVACLDYAQSLKAVFSGEENGTVILWDMTRGLQLSVVWCGACVPRQYGKEGMVDVDFQEMRLRPVCKY